MRKIHLFGLALMAVFAFGAITTATAFAESEWLVDGAPIAAGTSVATDTEGFLLLSDLKTTFGSAEILCDGSLDGLLLEKGLVEITEVLNLAGEKIAAELLGLALACTKEKICEEPISVWPANLPWSGEIVLMVGAGALEWLMLLATGTGGLPGYESECLIFGVTTTDLCEGQTSFWLENMAGEGDILAFAEELDQDNELLLGKCTLGAEQAGGLETEEESGAFGGALVLVTGKTLAVS